jgi:hypothetical protein
MRADLNTETLERFSSILTKDYVARIAGLYITELLLLAPHTAKQHPLTMDIASGSGKVSHPQSLNIKRT